MPYAYKMPYVEEKSTFFHGVYLFFTALYILCIRNGWCDVYMLKWIGALKAEMMPGEQDTHVHICKPTGLIKAQYLS